MISNHQTAHFFHVKTDQNWLHNTCYVRLSETLEVNVSMLSKDETTLICPILLSGGGWCGSAQLWTETEEKKKRKEERFKCSSGLMERQEWVDKAADRRSSGLSHSLRSLCYFNPCGTHLVVNSKNLQTHSQKRCLSHCGGCLKESHSASLLSSRLFFSSLSIIAEKAEYCTEQVTKKNTNNDNDNNNNKLDYHLQSLA